MQEFEQRGNKKVMKLAKHILFALIMVVGLSVATMAQKGGDGQKPPPKEKPPVIDPGKKPPPQNPPKGGGDKPKKPGFAFFVRLDENISDVA